MMHDTVSIAEENGHDIKAGTLDRNVGNPEIFAGGKQDVTPLYLIHSLFRCSELIGSSRLHFYKDNRVSIGRNDIHLRRTAFRPPVASDNRIPASLQIAMSEVFTPATPGVRRVACLQPGAMAQPVAQQSDPSQHRWPPTPTQSPCP